MRDTDTTRDTSLPLAVMVQPDPMLEERPAGPGRIIATTIGAAVIVVLAFYGMTRPAGQPEHVAAAPDPQAQPANQQPTTTGQGFADQAAQPDTKGGQPKAQASQSKTPPAAGGSATSATGPGARPAPQAR